MGIDYIDIGVNLLMRPLKRIYTKFLIAFNANINILINTSSSIEEANQSLELTKKYPSKIYTTAGVHPHNASIASDQLEELIEVLQNDCMIAIGECGLIIAEILVQ